MRQDSKLPAAAAMVMMASLAGCGTEGPAGAGTVIGDSATTAGTAIGASCTNLLAVSIDVPTSGTVVVQTQAWVTIEHTSGTRDLVNLLTSESSASCGIGAYGSAVDVPAGEPTATAFFAVSLQRPFAVTAGTYTFYFNGIMNLGQSANDALNSANMIAVFYPD